MLEQVVTRRENLSRLFSSDKGYAFEGGERHLTSQTVLRCRNFGQLHPTSTLTSERDCQKQSTLSSWPQDDSELDHSILS